MGRWGTTMQDMALWNRIAAHQFDAATSSAPFSVKPAQAEGWSKAYTNMVIAEYRKFVYLTQVSDTQVTPSQAVDRAWHMHLTFTCDYWEVFCPQVLGQPLHHEPCAGEGEMPRYRAQFVATKALYLREFGGPPPIAVWETRTSWRPIILGAVFGAVGLVALLAAIAAGHHALTLQVLTGFGMLATGWVYALLKLPHQPGAARDKQNGQGGCGG